MIRTVGLVYESLDDAKAAGNGGLDTVRHWREDSEVGRIRAAIEKAGYVVRTIGSPAVLLENLAGLRGEVDFIFNLSVGFLTRYRLGLAPALYSLAGIPYSGADPFTKIVTQNKHIVKSFWDKTGVPTPGWTYVDGLPALNELDWRDFPAIVKPAHEGTSVGIDADSVVHDGERLKAKARRILEELKIPVVVERFISGREIKVGMIGGETPVFEGMAENLTADGGRLGDGFLYCGAKSANTGVFARADPASLDCEAILADCRKIYRSFLPVDFGTFDLRIDGTGRHYFLEFNTDATLHPGRTLSRVCELNGLDYDVMIDKILSTALSRWGLE